MGCLPSGSEQSADSFCELPARHLSFRYLCFARWFSQIVAEVEKFGARSSEKDAARVIITVRRNVNSDVDSEDGASSGELVGV